MRANRIAAVFVSLAVGLVTRSGVVGAPDPRAEYGQARASLVERFGDFSKASGTPGFGVALNRAWSAIANWSAGFLDEHPDATAEQLAKALERLDPPRRCAATDVRCFDDYQLITALKPVVQDIRSDAGADLDFSLGMLGNSKITEENGRRFLLVEADNLNCRQLRFEIESRTDGPYLRELRVLNPCGGGKG